MAYKLGAVKPHVQAAAEEIGPKFGIGSIGGWRATGSVPNSDHPKGLALDFMTFNRSTGNAIVNYLIGNAGRLGVTYVIYWRQIWQDGKWESYSGPSPHIDHVHASFSAGGGSGGAIPAQNVGVPGIGDIPVLGELEHIAERLSDPEFWKRAGIYALGAALILMGIRMLLQRPIAEGVGTVVSVVGAGKGSKIAKVVGK